MRMIKNKVIATLVGLTSSAAIATTYTVDVSVTSQINQSLLQIKENNAMSFPEVTIAQESSIGSECIANGSANNLTANGTYTSNANSLCPRLTGRSSNFTLTGHPYAKVYVRVGAVEQIIDGLSFSVNSSDGSQTLNSGGYYYREVIGKIALVDPAATKTGIISFNYDFEAYYQ